MKINKSFKGLVVLIVMLLLATGCSNKPGNVAVGSLVVRVNPQIEVEYDKEGKAISIKALNEDGERIVQSYGKFEREDVEDVVEDIVELIREDGSLMKDETARNIIIQLEPGSELPSDDFMDNISNSVKQSLKNKEVNSQVININAQDYDQKYTKDKEHSRYITVNKAQEIALAHAGITGSKVTFDDREFDFENNRAVFELEFYVGNAEYEYEIDAITGNVIDYSVDYKNVTTPNKNNNYNNNSYNDNSYDKPSYDKPSYDAPSYDKPSYDAPSYDDPSYDTPSYDTPSYDDDSNN